MSNAKRQLPRRHPAEVASDRLLDACDRWRDLFSGAEMDMISQIRHKLEQIAEGTAADD